MEITAGGGKDPRAPASAGSSSGVVGHGGIDAGSGPDPASAAGSPGCERRRRAEVLWVCSAAPGVG